MRVFKSTDLKTLQRSSKRRRQ